MPPRTTTAHPSAPKGPALRFAPIDAMNLSAYVDIVRDAYPLFASDKESMVDRFRSILIGGYPQLIGAFDADDAWSGPTPTSRSPPRFSAGASRHGARHGRHRPRPEEEPGGPRHRPRLRAANAPRGAPLSFLYPFRHDFYAGMGWAPVAESRQHALPPAAFPLYPGAPAGPPGARAGLGGARPDPSPGDRPHGALSASPATRFAGRASSPGPRLPLWSTAPLGRRRERAEGYILARFTKRTDLPTPSTTTSRYRRWSGSPPARCAPCSDSSPRSATRSWRSSSTGRSTGTSTPCCDDPARRNTIALRNHQSPGPQVGLRRHAAAGGP